jgi:hypothetical protein
MDDLVYGIGCCRTIGIVPVMRRQFFGNLVQPFVEQRLRSGIERRKTADNAGFSLCDHQFRAGHNELRRSDERKAKIVENRR